jgi:hypothetical protein
MAANVDRSAPIISLALRDRRAKAVTSIAERGAESTSSNSISLGPSTHRGDPSEDHLVALADVGNSGAEGGTVFPYPRQLGAVVGRALP